MVNTIHHAMHKGTLKLYQAKTKLDGNMIQKVHLSLDQSSLTVVYLKKKSFSVVREINVLDLFLENKDTTSSGLKMKRRIQLVISAQFKGQHR